MNRTYSTRIGQSKVYHIQEELSSIGSFLFGPQSLCGIRNSLEFDWVWTNSRPKGKRVCKKCSAALRNERGQG